MVLPRLGLRVSTVFLIAHLGASPSRGQEAPAAPAAATATQAVTSDGNFQFEFRDSPWLPILQWYAGRAALNLDWQKLPEDQVNLSVQHSYSLDEVKDLLNMQLLARGYTLLVRGDVLRVVPLENLDPTLVPRIEADELEQRPPHDFVRVSFPLDWLVAEKAAKDLAPLLSPHGKLIPLETTNRLEALDAVVNLRELKRLLTNEQSDQGRERLVVEFRIEHGRASEIAEKVGALLGAGSTRGRRPDQARRMELDIEKAKLQSQAVEKLGKDATSLLKREEEAHIVVNEEQNSILINAAPDKIELARQAIQALDKPRDRTERVFENINKVKVYDLPDADPDTVEEMLSQLKELGNLDPDTRIEVDNRGDRIVAYATPGDHLLIAHLIQGLEHEGRHAEIIPLTVLEPRYAAKAINSLFTASGGGTRRRRRDSDNERFRVEPDLVHQRLLVWATEPEMVRVRQLLAELGEPDAATMADQRSYQVMELGDTSLESIEQQLRAFWSKLSGTPLHVETREHVAEDAEPTDKHSAAPDVAPDDDPTQADDVHRQNRPVNKTMSLAAHHIEHTLDNDQTGFSEVRIVEGQQGKILITSDDPASVGLMRQVLSDLLPEKSDAHVFRLRHASALSVQYQIQDWLEKREPEEDSDYALKVPEESGLALFADSRTNRLFVKDASDEELHKIESLIEMFDQPEDLDPELARRQEVYRAQHKQAETLAETVKEVYRDLLSENDKTFDNPRRGERRGSYGYWGFADSRKKRPEYRGLLSVGVDEGANAVVISAPGYLIEEVLGLLQRLDQTPPATKTAFVPLKGTILTAPEIQESLTRILGRQER